MHTKLSHAWFTHLSYKIAHCQMIHGTVSFTHLISFQRTTNVLYDIFYIIKMYFSMYSNPQFLTSQDIICNENLWTSTATSFFLIAPNSVFVDTKCAYFILLPCIYFVAGAVNVSFFQILSCQHPQIVFNTPLSLWIKNMLQRNKYKI